MDDQDEQKHQPLWKVGVVIAVTIIVIVAVLYVGMMDSLDWLSP